MFGTDHLKKNFNGGESGLRMRRFIDELVSFARLLLDNTVPRPPR
jgi:hypothetical protein